MSKSNVNFRTKKVSFTQVSNILTRDKTVSMKAKGLYLVIQSYVTIPNFVVNKTFLMSKALEREVAFESAWKELKRKGYLKLYRSPTGKDNQFVYEYDLLDEPDTSTGGLISLDKNGNVLDDSPHTPENRGSAKIDEKTSFPTPPIYDTVGETSSANDGGYSNTRSNYTNFFNTSHTKNKKEDAESAKQVVEKEGSETTTEIAPEMKSKNRTYDEIINEYTDDSALKTEIFEFIKMRKLNKRTVTSAALVKLLASLDEIATTYGEPKIEIVSHAMMNGWNSFYPKAKTKPKPKNTEFDYTTSSFDTDEFFQAALRRSYGED